MKKRLEEIMKKYGQQLTWVQRETGAETVVRAFLQPLLKEAKEPPAAVTPLGAADERRWLYIGPAAPEPRPGDELLCNGRRFVAQEAAAVCFRQETLYSRAILRRKKEMAA